jgi:hypothetical protein
LRILGASRSLWVKKLESGGQLRRGARSLRRRRSAEGSVSFSKRPGLYGRRRPQRDRRWLRGRSRALGQRDKPGCSSQSVASMRSLRWRMGAAMPEAQENAPPRQPRAAAQQQRGNEPGEARGAQHGRDRRRGDLAGIEFPYPTGHRGSLLLRCRAPSSPSPCWFIPAHTTRTGHTAHSISNRRSRSRSHYAPRPPTPAFADATGSAG